MKKVFTMIVIGLMTMNVMAQKLGHINSQEIMLQTTEYKAANTEMERYQNELKKQLEMYAGLLQEAEAQFQKDSPGLTEEIRQSRYNELMEKGQKFQEQQMDAEQKLQEKESVLLQGVMKKVQDAAAGVAKENGYIYVFDVNSLHFAGGDNLDELVKKRLGIVQ